MSGIIGLIIEIIAGIIGGNAAGAAAKNVSLGTAGNSIVGAIGGLVLGQILAALGLGAPGVEVTEGTAPEGAGLDVGALIGQLIGGGAGGAVLTPDRRPDPEHVPHVTNAVRPRRLTGVRRAT